MLRIGRTAVRQCVGILSAPRSRLLVLLAPSLLNNGMLQKTLDTGSMNSAASMARTLMSGPSRNGDNWVQSEINSFKRGVPVEEAVTPPSSWYTSPEILELELEKIFERRWLAVGRAEQLQSPGDFFTGKVGRVRYIVCMDEQGTVRAFHNVCRHHAAAVATGSGCTTSFVCPYHGWTYALDGKLLKATRLGGIKHFSAQKNGLSPLCASMWGPFVLISLPRKEANNMTEAKKLSGSTPQKYSVEREWLGSAAKVLTDAKIDSSVRHITTREYTLNCNWKVFCDNYLDGGYHVPYAHTNLASDLNLKSYSTTLAEKVSIQSCRAAKGDERVGESATYAFVYPNFMINRGSIKCGIICVLGTQPITFSMLRSWLKCCSQKNRVDAVGCTQHDKSFINASLQCSDVVQQEDIALCEAVQEGLQSPAYDVGRYAPNVEHAMHHFHTLLHEDLSPQSEAFSGIELEDVHQVLRDSR